MTAAGVAAMVDDAVRRISRALARVEQGHLRAFADDDRVILVVQDAPEQLRRLADALEKVNVGEIQAMIAYTRPSSPPKLALEGDGQAAASDVERSQD